ncbi:MAG: M14 family zinc carboxypeptidase [Rudaea sp.]
MRIVMCGFALAASVASMSSAFADDIYARDLNQAADAAYSKKIAEYTTDPSFNSPLTNYLPASSTVPTPQKVLGDISGAPNRLPYSKDVYRYFDLLAQSTPRVKVLRIGKSEEGRDMIVAAIADESLLADLNNNDARLAQLADPRTIQLDDAKADALVAQTTPIYYITGAIHSPETGAPTALMELAYRLAVDESPYIKKIRSHVITLITPVVEADGRDRMVDLYNWHRANPGKTPPPLLYWGHYVAHDNNRDAMGLTLNLSRNVLDTYLGWHAQVLHDLHESVPFLYDNTVGDGPYNAWVDPILVGEWQQLGWDNVQGLTKLGMPGVFTHGDFDTWSPGYLMFMAAMHNGISRLYETFGNDGADTRERILSPSEYARTWYRPNPPWPKVLWSQRNNNNYEQSALLVALNYFADNDKLFLRNFYLKSKRSIQKPTMAGPAAYVLPGDDAHRDAQAQMLRVLQLQHVEISRLTASTTVQVPAPPEKPTPGDDADKKKESAASKKPKTVAKEIPAGSYVVRMDQPYSRIADALLDRQFWAPDDPQKHPYDDTAWSFGDLFGTQVFRVSDSAILSTPMSAVREPVQAIGNTSGNGGVYLVEYHGDSSLITLRYAMRDAEFAVADEAFDAAGRHFGAGTLIIGKVNNSTSGKLTQAGLNVWQVAAKPDVPTHRLAAPRIALMHTWIDTQTEGWWRMALDKLGVPYTYINTQTVAREDNLRGKYDVILFAPLHAASSSMILNGVPMSGNPVPWKKTDLTPNMGIDSTDDTRPELGAAGLAHLQHFIEQGGVFLAAGGAAKFAVEMGLAPGVSIAPAKDLRVVGTIVNATVTDATSPINYGYDDTFAVYSEEGMSFKLSNLIAFGDSVPTAKDFKRPTGRGGPHDQDAPEGRAAIEAAELPDVKPWEAAPLNEEQKHYSPFYPNILVPEDQLPHTVLRFADADNLLVAGLLDGGGALAQRAAVVDARLGKGHTIVFAINPIWRGETIGSYALVFNTIMNFEHLSK